MRSIFFSSKIILIVTIFVLTKNLTMANSGSTMTYAMRMSATVKMTFI